MTSILCVGDVHLADKPPSNCTPAYNDQLFDMLAEVVRLSEEHDAVVFAGDVFHSKIPHRTSHRTVQRMIEIIQAFPCLVYIVPGNHDMQNDRLDSVYETQPLGSLLRAGARMLDGWAPDLPLYGIPWQQDWRNPDAKYFRDWSAEDNSALWQWGGLVNCLLVTHAPIYPPGRENPWECIPAAEFAQAMGAGSCYYGHVHDHHGSYVEYTDGGQSQVYFCNQGSLSRGCLQEEDLSRVPAVTAWRSDAVGTPFFRVELSSAPPATEVFRIAEAAAQVDYRERMAEFLAAVEASSVTRTSADAVLAAAREQGLSSVELALAEEVLAAAAAGELR